MRRPLAVFTPVVGHWAHAYVRPHIERILPGRTAVISVCALKEGERRWGVEDALLFVPPSLPESDFGDDPRSTKSDAIPARHRTLFESDEHQARIESFLHEQGVRVILAQWLDVGLLLLPLARRLGIPYFCQAHGTDITAALRDDAVRQQYQAYAESAGILVPSEFGRRQLLGLGLPAEKVHVVRHGVRVSPTPPRRSHDRVHCLAVGRMAPMKGPLVIIEAFARAFETCPDLRLHYVGGGLMRLAVERRITELDLRSRVTLHGPLPNEEVLALMQRCDILMHPSLCEADHPRYDTCPVAVSEAMAAGLAIVATRHGGIPEQVADGENGFLIDESDARALADRVVELARDPALRRRLGEAAWQHARKEFSDAVVRERTLEVLGLGERGRIPA